MCTYLNVFQLWLAQDMNRNDNSRYTTRNRNHYISRTALEIQA